MSAAEACAGCDRGPGSRELAQLQKIVMASGKEMYLYGPPLSPR